MTQSQGPIIPCNLIRFNAISIGQAFSAVLLCDLFCTEKQLEADWKFELPLQMSVAFMLAKTCKPTVWVQYPGKILLWIYKKIG